jgi:monofunctional biosynthetic peptidoglycan transglycosylase
VIALFKKLFVFGNFVIFFASALALCAVFAIAAFMTVPDVGIMEKCFTTTMYEVKLCPGSENYVALKDISPYVLHAVIAAEDGSFYSHKGFDWHEMKQSLNTDLASGEFHRGGSTLTQQLAKNAFLSKDKSLLRKLKEAYLANAIENRFSKNFILEKYLNVVEFGDNLYGIKPAALKYFHKPPSALHPLEAAWLAMLLPSPKKYSQSYRNGQLTPFARKMVATILKRMESFGKLSPAAYQTAVASIGSFPWSGLSLSSFAGNPGYDLETNTPMPAGPANVGAGDAGSGEAEGGGTGLDESAIEAVLKEDEDIAPPPPTTPPPPKAEPAAEEPKDDTSDMQ